jgi:hypothetical protein
MTQHEFNAIEELDLEPIKVKLMHEESGEGWSLERANAVEKEYRRFLYLMKKYPDEDAAPQQDVDTFWHYHILDTMKYAVDCERVFGYFLHHFPYVGLRGEADLEAHHRMGERMKELYEETFGDDYLQAATAWSASPRKSSPTAWSASPRKLTEALTAWSASPRKAAVTAWSASPRKAAAAVTTAWSASPRKSEATAWSASPRKAAEAGDTGAADNFYSERPRLS